METSLKNEDRAIRIKRLLYQSWYRGCKETDKILGKFARAHIEQLSDADLDDFERILSESDHDIFAWLTGKTTVPDAYKDCRVMEMLLSFDCSAG